jgi:hypothetical protein
MSSYALRLPESLKAASKRIAAQGDTTMNQFFVVAIAGKITAMGTADFFDRRSAKACKVKADKVWAKVGSELPQAHDRWTSVKSWFGRYLVCMIF